MPPTYSIEKLPDEPIVVATLHDDFSNAQHGEKAMADTVAFLDAQNEPVYYIFDISRYSPSLDDVISAVNWGGEKGSMPAFGHPNVHEPIIVSGSAMIRLAARGLKSKSWGHTTLRFFGTIEEALAYARQ